MSKTDDTQLDPSGQSPAGTAALAGSRAIGSAGTSAGPQNTPSVGLGMMAAAGAIARPVGTAGAMAQSSAGAAGAPRLGASAGQAATATAGAGTPGAQAGAGGMGAAGSVAAAAGRPASAAGTGATANTGPCPFPLRVDHVDDGVPVNGAGCHQQWEGIVMTKGGRGLCTAAFISDRHLISASHCYANDGSVSLDVSAPTWENGAGHTFQAQVKRSGSNMSLDISVIDLGKPVDWATPERRFVLHAGKVPASVDMHLYGFGDGGGSGAAGKLRGIPKRATIKVMADGKGNLTGKAGEARLCSGDSGGPAFVENTAAVLYAINQAIVPAGFGGGFGSCAGEDWSIMFTDVSAYMPFVEKSLGKMCERKQVDGLDVAQCW